LLKDALKSDDPLMKYITKRMMEKFDKYWNEYSIILSIAMILDPHVKLEALGFIILSLSFRLG